MKILAKLAGGSHAYGLETPQSDYDERYVFMHDNIADIIGMGKNQFVDKRNDTEDSFGFELRHFIESLQKTNTQVMEILFLPKLEFIEVHPMFINEIQENKLRLIDPDKYYTSLRGYIQNEKRLANGERIGKLGGKRREALEKHGYSPKNFVQLFRLAECGREFFQTGNFPVNIKNHDKSLWNFLMEIKTKPENFVVEELNRQVDEVEILLERSYNAMKKLRDVSHFDPQLANRILFNFYFPMLGKLNAQMQCI